MIPLHTMTSGTFGDMGEVPKTFPWKAWCDVAYKHRLRITGWPLLGMVPGYQFNRDKITQKQWQIMRAADIQIVAWDDGKLAIPIPCPAH